MAPPLKGLGDVWVTSSHNQGGGCRIFRSHWKLSHIEFRRGSGPLKFKVGGLAFLGSSDWGIFHVH